MGFCEKVSSYVARIMTRYAEIIVGLGLLIVVFWGCFFIFFLGGGAGY